MLLPAAPTHPAPRVALRSPPVPTLNSVRIQAWCPNKNIERPQSIDKPTPQHTWGAIYQHTAAIKYAQGMRVVVMCSQTQCRGHVSSTPLDRYASSCNHRHPAFLMASLIRPYHIGSIHGYNPHA